MQKTILITLAIIGTLTTGFFLLKDQSNVKFVPIAAHKSVYNLWKINFNVNVGAAEDNFRFGVFSINYQKIQQHNSRASKKFTLGLNAFTHLTQEEFASTHLGLKNVRLSQNTVAPTVTSKGQADWTSYMNAVQDQGQCGGCWAFSAAGAIEGLNSIKFGDKTKLSEQDLISCSMSYGNAGCNGGLMDLAFQFAIDNHGLATEAAVPYTATNGTCNSGVKRQGKITGFTDVTANNAEALKAAIDLQPISVAIEADTYAFQGYTGGVIDADAGCGGDQLDHGVIAVGYNAAPSNGDLPYYIVRNSWGASWGENGYVRIEIADGEGVCGIQQAASYPTA